MKTETRLCPYCAEEIAHEVVVCPYCSRDVVAPFQAQSVPETQEKPENSPGRTLVLLGGASLIIGALLPWASMTAPFVGTLTVSGYQGDGLLSGLIGVILLIGGFISRGRKGQRYSIAAVGLAVLAGLLVIPKFSSLGSAIGEMELGFGSLGVGLYLSALGVALAFVGGLVHVPNNR